MLAAIDKQEVTLLFLLDLSAAFEKIDHELLVNVLQYDFGICGVVKGWIKSFLFQGSSE